MINIIFSGFKTTILLVMFKDECEIKMDLRLPETYETSKNALIPALILVLSVQL